MPSFLLFFAPKTLSMIALIKDVWNIFLLHPWKTMVSELGFQSSKFWILLWFSFIILVLSSLYVVACHAVSDCEMECALNWLRTMVYTDILCMQYLMSSDDFINRYT